MKHTAAWLMLWAGLAGCGATKPRPVEVNVMPSVHRPSWLHHVSDDIGPIRACIDARGDTSFAVFVYKELPGVEVGVTTLGDDGSVVHCTWDVREARVRAQTPLDMTAEEVSRQPMLSLGEHPPVVPRDAHIEPVVAGEERLGWVFWLPL